ncbi:hypothetical protein HUJ05_013099 [Dendroctonus ponderosae]|nr:hypothetical protein HUJ05_013099 [Dendroctonus ponderosae]
MANFLAFKTDKLGVEEVTGLVSAPSCGANSIFVGTTRDNFNGKTVTNLEYEAYDSMGIKAMETICLDMRKKWPEVVNIVIHHRLGEVPIKEASVIIAVSSPHREEALKATEFCINRLKQSVPIWKKEIYSDTAVMSYPPKRKKHEFSITQEVQNDYFPPHLIQIKAANEELNIRIEKFMERKRADINAHNNTEFFQRGREPEFSCARIDAIVVKRKDSNSHLQVEKVLNSYQYRDQKTFDYLKRYIPSNGIDERLQSLESQLSMDKAVPKNVYQRIKHLEDRLLHLESLSPEYLQFWDKTSVMSTKSMKKRTFELSEIDELTAEVERKCPKAC